jgi:hypothetical protein
MLEMTNENCGVTISERSGMRYREGTRSLFVDGEMLTGESDFIVYPGSIQVWDDGAKVTNQDSIRIVENIGTVFRLHGISLTIGS